MVSVRRTPTRYTQPVSVCRRFHSRATTSWVTILRTPMAAPETVADVAGELVRRQQPPDHEFRAEWDGARDVRTAADDFRRSRLGPGPLQLREGRTDSTTNAGPGVQLSIDTQADTYGKPWRR
ncbi:hypothetical protein [Streptomyces canus]|uniref:hypothetical protein n=1 Tax=Streptomyces canus TaxID=58343 RepID=UPI002DDB5C81|nr:hypothetical protein [Streptomyces canus]WSD92677.1 hypothetical protein OG925_51390 [Streptomyces canus]